MDWVEAFIIGIVQGLTEWLPVSSSGQGVLALVNIFHIDPSEALAFSFFLHLGTLFAVFVYFREDIIKIIMALPNFNKPENNDEYSFLARFLIVSTISTGLVGVPVFIVLKDSLTHMGLRINILIGITLILTGIILYFSRRAENAGTRGIGNSRTRDMLFAGAAQGIAVIPGISRSGATVAVLLLSGFKQEEALRISFLMAVPAIIGANVLEFLGGEIVSFPASSLMAGLIAAFLFSLASIKILLGVAQRVRFDIFVFIFGLIAVLMSVL